MIILSFLIFADINLGNEHFDYCNPEITNHVRLMVLYNKFKQSKKHR